MTPPTQPWKPPRLAHGTPAAIITGRQAQVLAGLCVGLSNAEIGRELYVTEETVKRHVRGILRAFGVGNRAHAAALAISGQVAVYVKDVA
jgi:DNA-binding NarL/FixJ family response regulator